MTSVDFQQRLRDLVNLSIRTYTGQAAGFEERDSLIAALTRSHATLLVERDAARAEVERLREAATTTATMLAIWGPETFPEVNEHGQVHFARALMESAAESLFEVLPPEAKQAMEAKRAEILAITGLAP